MITSKLTAKAQTTVPRSVRLAPRLNAGDELVYYIQGDRVILPEVSRNPLDNPFADITEWNSAADRIACGTL